LESGRNYTVAVYYKLINGQRMGITLKDYKITGEGYLVPLLCDYLFKNKYMDIDAKLNSLELITF
jgi:hypothetical protein